MKHIAVKKQSKWRRYLNILLGISNKAVRIAEIDVSVSSDPSANAREIITERLIAERAHAAMDGKEAELQLCRQ